MRQQSIWQERLQSVLRRLSIRTLALAMLATCGVLSVGWAMAVGTEEVDTALIVAIDVSNSVDDKRYQLQIEGIAQALEDPEVIQAIIGGAKGGILFSLVTWSDKANLSMGWTRISSAAEAKLAAKKIRSLPRAGGEFTCMATMMRQVSDKIVPQIPSKAAKVVLDVSGDGADNCNTEEPVEAVRDELVSYGVTVNGLPILDAAGPEVVTPGAPSTQSYLPSKQNVDPLEQWFRDSVKGGPGSFVLPAYGYEDFGRAIRQKFVLEVSEHNAPARRDYAATRPRFFTP
jgi:hypothetical protein